MLPNFLSLKKILVLTNALTSIICSPLQDKRQASGSLEAWLATESSIARQGVLNNIGAEGPKAHGANAGIVIASPSKNEPPC